MMSVGFLDLALAQGSETLLCHVAGKTGRNTEIVIASRAVVMSKEVYSKNLTSSTMFEIANSYPSLLRLGIFD